MAWHDVVSYAAISHLNVVIQRTSSLGCDVWMAVDKAGWGDWAGPGMTGISRRVEMKRKRKLQELDEERQRGRRSRVDGARGMLHVMVSAKRVKSASKYRVAKVPYPFTSREEYERSIQMPLGGKKGWPDG